MIDLFRIHYFFFQYYFIDFGLRIAPTTHLQCHQLEYVVNQVYCAIWLLYTQVDIGSAVVIIFMDIVNRFAGFPINWSVSSNTCGGIKIRCQGAYTNTKSEAYRS